MRKKDNKDKKHCNKKIVIVLLIAVLGISSFLGEKRFSKPQEISYKEFCQKVESNDVSEISINMEKDNFTFCCMDLRGQERLYWQKLLPGRQGFRSLLYQVQILMKNM